MVARAPRRARLGRAEALPFADDSFGGVALLYVLYHLDDPAIALAEARRIGRPGDLVVAAARAAMTRRNSLCPPATIAHVRRRERARAHGQASRSRRGGCLGCALDHAPRTASGKGLPDRGGHWRQPRCRRGLAGRPAPHGHQAWRRGLGQNLSVCHALCRAGSSPASFHRMVVIHPGLSVFSSAISQEPSG